MPRISIIVTSYNIEAYIEGCLESITKQTVRDLEIIVVDDGSTDSSPDIIRRIAEQDDRIVPVLLTENSVGGVATAANAGLDRATADYVGFADGDDLYEPTMFERLLDAAESHDADLSMCRYGILDDHTGAISEPADAGRWDALDQPVYRLDTPETRKQFLRFIAVPWRKLYRRSLIEQHGIRFPVGDYFYEDNPFHWFSVLSANAIAVVPESLCQHRVARAGQTMSTADERLFKIFEHHDTIKTWLDQRGLTDEFGPTLLGWAISQMEWIAPRTPDNLRRTLFGVLRGIYAQYDDDTVQRALIEGRKGDRAKRLSAAVLADDLAEFDRALERKARPTNPLVSAAHHLRHDGVGKTAKITGRYLRRQAGRVPVPRSSSRSATTIQNRDLMFGLMVIEERLANLERRVSEVADHLERDQ